MKSAERTMLFVCSDGLFSKHAFPSLARVIRFLIDPQVGVGVGVGVDVDVGVGVGVGMGVGVGVGVGVWV